MNPLARVDTLDSSEGLGTAEGMEMPGSSFVTRLERRASQVGLDLIVLGLLTLVFLVLAVIYGGQVRFRDGSVIWPTVVLVAIVVVRAVGRWRVTAAGDVGARREVLKDALRVTRDWVPIILMIMVYENLRTLTGVIRPDSIDQHLYAADVALFGVEPTVWIQRFANPWLTDYFAFAYMLYFILPLAMGTMLYLAGRRDGFRELMLGLILVQYVGFALYLVFPAGPPRFAIPELYDPPRLTGALGLFEVTHGAYDSLNTTSCHSSFPSLHCALSLTGLIYAWKFRSVRGGQWMFWISLPLVVSLWTATIYLRHHWIVDCFAGFALSSAMVPLAAWLWRRHVAFRARVMAVVVGA
jgi:membrane-associated phospholipid phosphatase